MYLTFPHRDPVFKYATLFTPTRSFYQFHLNDFQKLFVIDMQEKWQIGDGKFKSKKWDEVFFNMNKAFCISLTLNKNSFCSIPENIAYPKFVFLTELSLKQNNISNLERIVFLDMINLQVLDLESNRIHDMKALEKTHWTHMKSIKIGNNPMAQFAGYSFCSIRAQTQLSLEPGNEVQKNMMLTPNFPLAAKSQIMCQQLIGTFKKYNSKLLQTKTEQIKEKQCSR